MLTVRFPVVCLADRGPTQRLRRPRTTIAPLLWKPSKVLTGTASLIYSTSRFLSPMARKIPGIVVL
jgi:hypothetical protein